MKNIFIYTFTLFLLISMNFVACRDRKPAAKEGSEKPQTEEKADHLDDTGDAKTRNNNTAPKAPPKMIGYAANCDGSATDLAGPVLEIAKGLEAQKFTYDRSNLADCSGMFHRMLQGIKEKCPEQEFPAPKEARSTRDLAKWYHTHSKLILITDEAAQKDLIKPGAVMFYGQGGKAYDSFTANDLFARGSGINHVGIVVAVEKDKNGDIKNYHLFHGRNPKSPASITTFHYLVPTRDSYPPLGNGSQQWVAFAKVTKDLVK